MKHIDDLPHKVEVIEHQWIEMADGTRLSARIWMPVDARQNPVPAIFEYIPYRKRDLTRERDDPMHGYFAGHGYACVRLDIRGSGESEGVLADEYLQSELDDGCRAMEWIAAQDWCDGNIGMIGISWGGFNGLQIAAMQPPQLKAVISIASTDDRYADDIHHMGGCLLGDNLSWASVMFVHNSHPPDPAIVGEKWRDMWLERLQGSGLWLEKWLEHQRRDAYWQHGSICEDYAAVKTPIMSVSGWADGYTNAVFRMLENLDCPRQGLVGPWSHRYPHLGMPGPAIGFLQEALRWWDYWLKGRDTGIMAEPMLRAYMQNPVEPDTFYNYKPGRWVGEAEWPSPCITQEVYAIAPHELFKQSGWGEQEEDDTVLSILSPLSTGMFAGKWCSYAAAPDMPDDQREEDGGALVFETEPLDQDMEILGAPVATLNLASDREVAMVAVRLSDVAPDGKATRITYGVLNLTHRNRSARPEELEPGAVYTVDVRMNHVAQRFCKGHRIRMSVSSSYFPLAWLPPEPVTLSFHTAGSTLALPVRPVREEDRQIAFGPPESGLPAPVTQIEPQHFNWYVIRDLGKGTDTLEVVEDNGVVRFDDPGHAIGWHTIEKYSVTRDDVTSARGEVVNTSTFTRDDWEVKTHTRTLLTCDKDDFIIRAELDAYEGEARLFSRNWDVRIKRDCV